MRPHPQSVQSALGLASLCPQQLPLNSHSLHDQSQQLSPVPSEQAASGDTDPGTAPRSAALAGQGLESCQPVQTAHPHWGNTLRGQESSRGLWDRCPCPLQLCAACWWGRTGKGCSRGDMGLAWLAA